MLRALVSAPRLMSVETIEEKLRGMFPTGYPVLCSSGRAALVIALLESEVSRGDLVGVFPYASHCVLDAVSRVATPLSGPTAVAVALRVVYHQWGFVQETDLSKNTIEDCVDTLCVPGAAIFPGGGRFEIWSLPKIIGTTSGAVLWCRDSETAAKIRCFRDERGGGYSLGGLGCLQSGTQELICIGRGLKVIWDEYLVCKPAKFSRLSSTGTSSFLIALRK